MVNSTHYDVTLGHYLKSASDVSYSYEETDRYKAENGVSIIAYFGRVLRRELIYSRQKIKK